MATNKKSAKSASKAHRKLDITSDGFSLIGDNVAAKENSDGLMEIRIDLGVDLGKSAKGKSLLVASTRGNTSVARGLKLGLNLYEPLSK